MNNHEKRQPKEDKGDEPINNTFIYTTPVEQRSGTSSTPDEERYEAGCKRKSKPHRVDLAQTVDEAGNDAYCEEIKQGEKKRDGLVTLSTADGTDNLGFVPEFSSYKDYDEFLQDTNNPGLNDELQQWAEEMLLKYMQ